ncbi:TetR/AcrR family transcriptional regulator [Actinokineospora sp. NPDC004072]
MTQVTRPTRTRRTAEDRRRQLIGIGLRMLTTRPLHDITVDDVAAEAGIARSLLFHYFPTKQDYYVEVVRAAGRRLLRATRVDPDAPGPVRLRAIVDGYIAFLNRRRTQYVGLFRAGGQGDWVRAVHDETQTALTARTLDALGLADPDEVTELAVRAWWAFAEELTIEWTGRGRTDRDTLADLLLSTLEGLVRR